MASGMLFVRLCKVPTEIRRGFYRIVWLNWNKPLINLVKAFSKSVGEWNEVLEGEHWLGFWYHNYWIRGLMSKKPSFLGEGSWLFQDSPIVDSHFPPCRISDSVNSFLFHMGGKEGNSFSSSEHPHSPEINGTQVTEPGSYSAYWIG